jgi:hypothetical protein
MRYAAAVSIEQYRTFEKAALELKMSPALQASAAIKRQSLCASSG